MAELTHQQYDLLERAITDQRRIAVMRRGTVRALLSVERGREAIQARHPSGSLMTFYVDEVQSIEVVK